MNGINLRFTILKRQHASAVVFLFAALNLTQVAYSIEYKTEYKSTSINYASDDSITIKKISKINFDEQVKNDEVIKNDLQEEKNLETKSTVITPTEAEPVTTISSEPIIETLRPAVSIIIDDIGDRLKDGMRAVSLPAPYTYSFLPNTPFARRLAKAAHDMNKEVMLHIPMEANNGKKLGPNGLTSDMSREVFDKTLLDAFNSIPHIRGFNNHMGSLLTANKENMNWVMNFIAKQNNSFYFVDSRTTAKSVIVKVAKEKNISVISRDSFLDYESTVESITRQIYYLIKLAKKNGSAIGIAHPYPETLKVLESAWPLFYEAGVDLIPVSELIALESKRELSEWRLSSSH